MDCKCSFKNDYEVISLCDLECFNEKMQKFSSKSWSHLSIPKILKIPEENPPVKSIKKVHLNIKINSSKIIKTPSSDIPNIENSTLTGKSLLVSGEISIHMFYVSKNNFSKIHSLKFNQFFSKPIALDENEDLNYTSFSVYACVENIFINPITPRNLSSNLSLFLFAYKEANKLSNKIIVKSKNDKVVLTIDFNQDTNQFIVNSTKVIPDPSSSDPYFTLVLEHRISGKELLKATLNSDENGENFRTILNGETYPLNLNRLLLFYKDKTKIEITNYPIPCDTYIPSEDVDIFEITQDALVNKALDSKVVFINDDNNELATIRFMDTGNFTRIIATSTNNISSNVVENNKVYSQMFLYAGGSALFNGIILGRENALSLVNELNRKPLGFLNPIKLNSKFLNKIIITNYKGEDEYFVEQEPEFLTTNNLAIIPYDLNYNKIVLKNMDNSNILFIYLDGPKEKFFIYSTGIVNVDSDNFSIKVKNPTETFIKHQESISKNQNADLINTPTFRSFNYGDILELTYSNEKLVQITDLPNKGDILNPPKNSVKFTMTRNGLVLK